MEQINRQLELFTQLNKEGRSLVKTNSVISSLRSYEKMIITGILFIVTGVVSFSLGVERGKTIFQQRMNLRVELAEKKQPVKPDFIKEEVTRPQKEEPVIENYIIQVASYQNKSSADKEANVLKRKGLTPFVLSKGRFNVLYVGKFSSKERARSVLTELKKQYRDCLIRRM